MSARLDLIRWCAERDTDGMWQMDEGVSCCGCGMPTRTVSFSFEGAFHLRCLVRFWEEFFEYERTHPIPPDAWEGGEHHHPAG